MQGVKAEKGKTHAARDGVNGVAEKRRVRSPLPDGFEGWGGRGDGEDGQNPLPVKKRRVVGGDAYGVGSGYGGQKRDKGRRGRRTRLVGRNQTLPRLFYPSQKTLGGLSDLLQTFTNRRVL